MLIPIPSYLAPDLVQGQRRSTGALRALLEALGRPHTRIPTVLIGGTNGKGSTQALLAAMLRAAGYKTGTFTSPAMLDFHDQIAGDQGPLSAGDAAKLWEQVKAVGGAGQLTLFEAATLLAFLYFSNQAPDIALIETGLGGTHDAVNVCDPFLSLITEIDLDHTAVLGSSIEAIAEEKVGLARPNRLLLTSARGVAADVLVRTAKTMGASVECVYEQASFERTSRGWCYLSAKRRWEGLVPGLKAAYQKNNCLLALRALEHLEAHGFPIDEEAAKTGLNRAGLPGRFEWLRDAGGRRVLFDGAHNPHGARGLVESLPSSKEGQIRVVILSIFSDKDVRALVETFAEAFEGLIATTSGHPRALAPEDLRRCIEQALGHRRMIESAPDPAAALEAAEGYHPDLVVVAGTLSLYRPLRALGFEPEAAK